VARRADHLLATTVLALLLFLLPACTAITSPTSSGHLVIVGGGLKDENAPIFNRFESLCADGPIGIIPLASGDGLKAGESVAERWRKYSTTRQVVVIPLTQHDTDKANDPTIAAQIRSCGGLWFTGGDQSRITKVLRPDPATHTACYDACMSVLSEKNGVIGGTSAGAAMMSDPMITGGRSASAKSARNSDPDNQDSHRVTTAPGMGFLANGLTDQHFVQRGRLGRLIDALRDTGIQRGFAVSENCAIIVDRNSGVCEALGEDYAVWILNATSPRPLDPGQTSLRVSILSSGDRIDPLRERVVPAPPLRDVRGDGVSEVRRAVDDVWSRASISQALEHIAGSGGRSATFTLIDARTSLAFIADEKSSVYVGIPGRTPCFANLRVVVKPAVKSAAK
jgi:cyanophycinase